VAHIEIVLYSEKANTKFQIIEPKLFALNEIARRIPPNDAVNFEICRKSYVSMRKKFDNILAFEAKNYPIINKGDMWNYH